MSECLCVGPDREAKTQKSRKYRCVYIFISANFMCPVRCSTHSVFTLFHVFECSMIAAVCTHTPAPTPAHEYIQTHLLRYVWHMCLFCKWASSSSSSTPLRNVKTHSCHSRNYVFAFAVCCKFWQCPMTIRSFVCSFVCLAYPFIRFGCFESFTLIFPYRFSNGFFHCLNHKKNIVINAISQRL